jgi:hypothetical protein
MNGTLTIPYFVSLAVGRPDIGARQNVLALFIGPPVSALAIYRFGLSGAGFSMMLLHVFLYLYGLPRVCRECIGIPPRTWYWHVLRIIASALLIYGSAWGLITWVGRFSILALATGYVVASIIYGAVAYELMDDSLRATILHYVTLGRGVFQRAVVAP